MSARMHLTGCLGWAATLVLLSPLGNGAEPLANSPPLPHWIWHCDTNALQQPATPLGCRLERSIDVSQAVQSASLRLAADFCQATVNINGLPVVSVEPYSPTVDVDVTAALRAGQNDIVVAATSSGGPAALALSLHLRSAAGTTTTVSDQHWSALPTAAASNSSEKPGQPHRPAHSLGEVDPALWGAGRRPATIDPFENYEQWRQATGAAAAERTAKFWTAPGFAISVVRTAHPDEGSWVSMAFDPQGRLTIAREDKGLLRMTLTTDHRAIDRVETINDDLQECRGLLYAYDALYANANNSKGLYKLRDTDGDDRFDDVRLLRQFPGSVGHGRNDLALGPDGLIYSIHGDSVDIAVSDITDYTSPQREARRGKITREGHLLRTDRDGQRWELVAAGLRNPFGIAFGPYGDAFTYDADAEFDMGSPWYRPTRIVQLVQGGDFGWRGVTGKWPPYFPDHPDNALPTLDIGRGSPTAVAFGTQTNFPGDYRDALFVLDWAYGRVLAVHLAPRGAGYRAQAETFLQGRPLNVTDLAVGPDGALYLITGGRKTQSALYRIVSVSGDHGSKPQAGHEAACREQARAARALRTKLEGYHHTADLSCVDEIWPHLDSPDPQIRYAARMALEHQPLAAWRDLALREPQTTAALTALAVLAQSGDQASAPAIMQRLLTMPAAELNVGSMLMLLQAYALCLDRVPDVTLGQRERIVAQLNPCFPAPAARWLHHGPAGTGRQVERELARLLVELRAPEVIPRIVQSLLASGLQADRLQGLFVLRSVREGWTLPPRRAYFTALNEAGTFLGGEGMPKFVNKLREEALATLTDQDRHQLADVLTAQSAPADEALPPARPVIRRWTVDDLLALMETTPSQGNAERGAIVFRDALCVRCHRSGARGPAVGPELTHVSRRFSRRDILDSIINPSAVVAENYRSVHVRTLAGQTVVGRVLIEGDFRSERLRIATDALRPAAITELNKREIDEVRESDVSPMPAGLLDPFRADEILDLLAFLEGGTDR